jgi:hypothetical protein
MKSSKSSRLETRLVRIETRLCTIMKSLGLDPYKDDSQLEVTCTNTEPGVRRSSHSADSSSFGRRDTLSYDESDT